VPSRGGSALSRLFVRFAVTALRMRCTPILFHLSPMLEAKLISLMGTATQLSRRSLPTVPLPPHPRPPPLSSRLTISAVLSLVESLCLSNSLTALERVHSPHSVIYCIAQPATRRMHLPASPPSWPSSHTSSSCFFRFMHHHPRSDERHRMTFAVQVQKCSCKTWSSSCSVHSSDV
jgi:hypothetical protein